MKKRIQSFQHAFNGLTYSFKTQTNFKIHTAATLFVIIAGFAFECTLFEWLFIALAATLVLFTELFNTAIELLADKVEPNYSLEIKHVKDVAAAAVLVASLFAWVVATVVFIPKLVVLF